MHKQLYCLETDSKSLLYERKFFVYHLTILNEVVKKLEFMWDEDAGKWAQSVLHHLYFDFLV
jgi:hypothetical protein